LLRHYQERQADKKGSVRKVWLFEFRIHTTPATVPVDQATTLTATLLAESRKKNPVTPLDREITESPEEEQMMQLAGTEDLEAVRARILLIQPLKFEYFIKTVMEQSGFVRVSVTRASGDGGIDLDAYVDENNDFFSGTHVQAQVKRWRHAVGSPDLNSFRGALSTTAKGLFVTTSSFTRAAVNEARHPTKPSISLIDGLRLSAIATRLNIDE
jgi:restriction system protein